MASVPEFLLRKLFVPGSFKPLAGGFSFQLNNTLMAVTIIALEIAVDSSPIVPEGLFLQWVDEKEFMSSDVSEASPLLLVLSKVLTVRAVSSAAKIQKLTISATTLELGELSFSISLKEKKENLVTHGVKQFAANFRSILLERRVARDPLHPTYHFTPPANWMNDPNGLIQWQGQTHLFYQYNPTAPVWGSIHWGHAVSRDLVHWQRLPVAFTPQAGTPNQDGCWSGSAFFTKDGPLFVYTAVFPETVCLAQPDPTFEKLTTVGASPIISTPPANLSVKGFRDPVVWQEGKNWFLSIGCGIERQGGAVLLYESTDLLHWKYLHPLLQGDLQQTQPFPTGFMWECSQLFELGGDAFLFISAILEPGRQYSFYFQGKYSHQRFVANNQKFMDFGKGVYYAPLSFTDERERRIQFGWLTEARDEAATRQAGWAGVLSLPRWLRLSTDHELLVDPIPEVDTLRKGLISEFSGELSADFEEISKGKPITATELELTAVSAQGGKIIIKLAESTSASDAAQITYDFTAGILRVDTGSSMGVQEAPLGLQAGQTLELRVYLDGSVIEVYANHRVVISSRYYPKTMRRQRMYIAGIGQPVLVEVLQLWQMGVACCKENRTFVFDGRTITLECKGMTGKRRSFLNSGISGSARTTNLQIRCSRTRVLCRIYRVNMSIETNI